ncbi:hypothetical protein A5320_14505 [Rheinheimera sp. SA_1]|uniref:ZrgA family zinc uptake protein n=1 Tax=Rheinheimera sp. SA_1 TaxID=1827365 RepID=UPI000801C4DE|nr:DUF2796 domain-containing protein [Rheinheimera sp. SA_1]OBP13884.1 hypothetical protein A5320_14505 [Rheinheimera sp. SA_1]
MRIIPFTLLLFMAPMMPTTGEAAANHAHQHGVAQMELIKLDRDLQITFLVTAADLVGFEHQAQSLQQQQRIEQAEMLLAEGGKVFSITGGECTQISQQSNLHQLHNDTGAAAKQNEHQHTDLTVSYQFKCTNLTTQMSVEVRLFALFSALQKIETSWITDTTQSSATLTATTNRLQIE